MTVEQIKYLLNFLKEKNIEKGSFRSASIRRLWALLTMELNAMGGSIKTRKQWRRVWADRKYLTKKAAAASKRPAATTEGGPSEAPPSKLDSSGLEAMGSAFGIPLTKATVPLFSEEESTSEESCEDSELQFCELPKRTKWRDDHIEQYIASEKDGTRAIQNLTSALNSLVSGTGVLEELTSALNSLVSGTGVLEELTLALNSLASLLNKKLR